MKKVIVGILLLFVGVSIAFLIFQELHKGNNSYAVVKSSAKANDGSINEGSVKPDANVVKSSAKANDDSINEGSVKPDADVDIVYYFMTNQRCPSCMKIEAYAEEAVKRGFTDQLKNHELVWKMVKVDEPQNNHFIKDYELFTKSVVLVKIRDGKQVSWKNLDKVWTLLGDKTEFMAYVAEEVQTFLEKG